MARSPMSALTGSAKLKSLPAPIGGWNARDAMSEMEPIDAIVLDNFIPDMLGVQQRRGYSVQATGLNGSYIESLMEYDPAGGTPVLFAAVPNHIYNVSASGAVGAASLTGLTNGRWQHTMFSTPGGNFLVICNGADSVRNYDGTSWTTPSITGVTSSTLVNVCAHLSRLWFVRQSTLKVYYLPSQSIAGAATEIDFAPICKYGGELIAMASWSRDGGAGLDDFAVFVTSKGEVLVYQGTDPDSTTTWGLVGIFKAPEPIGKRCFIKLGADLCFLSAQGVLPLPQFLSKSSAGVAKIAVTDKISGAFIAAYLSGGSSFGWQVIEYPREALLIVNVPIRERAEQHQYVMNLKTGAWCRFKNMNAGCLGLKNGALYFGGNDGKVYAYGGTSVYADNGSAVNAVAVQAFNNFGTNQRKHFKMARPLMAGPDGYLPQVKMLIDYDATTLPSFTPTSYDVIGPSWDVEPWDIALWATGLVVSNLWQGITGTGMVGAIGMASQVTTRLIWNQTDILYDTGGPL